VYERERKGKIAHPDGWKVVDYRSSDMWSIQCITASAYVLFSLFLYFDNGKGREKESNDERRLWSSPLPSPLPLSP